MTAKLDKVTAELAAEKGKPIPVPARNASVAPAPTPPPKPKSTPGSNSTTRSQAQVEDSQVTELKKRVATLEKRNALLEKQVADLMAKSSSTMPLLDTKMTWPDSQIPDADQALTPNPLSSSVAQGIALQAPAAPKVTDFRVSAHSQGFAASTTPASPLGSFNISALRIFSLDHHSRSTHLDRRRCLQVARVNRDGHILWGVREEPH